MHRTTGRYVYSARGVVADASKLLDEIEAGVSPSCQHILYDVATLEIVVVYEPELDGGDKTLLDAIIASHTA